MREIKFRAWDNKWSRWIAPDDVEVMGDGWVWCTRRSERGDEIETDALHDDNFVIEQYTGLKDKNGRDIYDGDICVFTPKRWVRQDGHYTRNAIGIITDWPKDIYEDDISNPPFVVEWNDCGGWYPFTDNDDGMPYPDAERCEVIGNIHENPEMVKA